jgi:isoaspartyl peptidase/L-asparaginase-like protein (Ntn-hydrolase superfamily)
MARTKGSKNIKTLAGGGITAIARKHCEEAIKVAAQIMNSTSSIEADRLNAVKIILERGYGKPSQQVEHSGNIDLPRVTFEVIPKSDRDKA